MRIHRTGRAFPAILLMTSFCVAFPFTTNVSAQRQARPQESSGDAEAEFFRGYYLQTESRDYKSSMQAYRRAIELGADGEIRQRIEQQIAALEEDLASSDFAALMPGDAIGFVEIIRPADHVERIAELMGLTGRPHDADEEVVTIRMPDGMAISSDFQISPALMRELKKIRGAAVAVTGIDNRGEPEGVAIIHPGDSDLVTGLLETGVQLVPSTEKIGGHPTYQIENELWIVKTERLILAALDKEMIAGCITRISETTSGSLAAEQAFRDARKLHDGSALFGYVNPSRVLEQLDDRALREIAVPRFLFDLEHLNSISASIGGVEDGIQIQANVCYAENHNSIGYGLLRTSPLAGNAISSVPESAAVVIGLGLNPQILNIVPRAGNETLISAMDLGRELFSNIREVSLFALPQVTGRNNEVPELGLIITSSDVEKSSALWNQLLTLPSRMEIEEGLSAGDVQIEGVAARKFTFPDRQAPYLFVARLNDDALIAGTAQAVKAAIVAQKNGTTLTTDKIVGDAVSAETAKLALVRIGRVMRMAAALEGGPQQQEVEQIASVLGDMNGLVTIDEGPAELQVRVKLSALPQFREILKTAARMMPANDRQRVRGEAYADRADMPVPHAEPVQDSPARNR